MNIFEWTLRYWKTCHYLIYSDITYFFIKNHATQEDPLALLTTFTETTNFNMSGTILKSAFHLGTQTSALYENKKTKLQSKLHQLQHFITTECSMVSSQMMEVMNDHCLVIKQADPCDQNFDIVSVTCHRGSLTTSACEGQCSI